MHPIPWLKKSGMYAQLATLTIYKTHMHVCTRTHPQLVLKLAHLLQLM